jgi:hypothetical protein
MSKYVIMSGITTPKNDNWGRPHLPPSPSLNIDGQPLTAIRDFMTAMPSDSVTEQALASVIQKWDSDPRSIEPIRGIRQVLDKIRLLPRGQSRLTAMNTFVRTLGRPQALATLLDMLRDSAAREGTHEEKLTLPSRNGTQHAVYGWAGQTLLLLSDFGDHDGAVEAEPGALELLGEKAIPGLWALSMHIWQPNPCAQAFPSGARIEPGAVVEPPHSHPFDFSSMISAGVMRQSIYAHSRPGGASHPRAGGRYDGIRLAHVDGVWPEHQYRSSCGLATVEENVVLRAGDSYFMPTDMIHDVEFDAKTAATTPAITLFLASEAVVVPHVYMADSMAVAHDENPDLKSSGKALSAAAWEAKLSAVSAYLRGERSALSLADIVRHDGTYAFFHKA